MIIRTDDIRNIVLFGESLADVEHYLTTSTRRWPRAFSRDEPASARWDLGAGWEGAKDLARHGWEQGAKDIQFSAVEAAGTESLVTVEYDVAGQYPDVGRFCAGEPLHMASRRKRSKPVVNLLVNVCASAVIDAQVYLRYGSAVAALVDQLENTGHRVGVYVVGANKHSGKGRSVVGWTVKSPQDALDYNAVAFSIAHPAAFRRFMFALWERMDPRLYDSGYGQPTDLDAKDVAALDLPEDTVRLEGVGLFSRVMTVREALDRLRANVRTALGAEILGGDL